MSGFEHFDTGFKINSPKQMLDSKGAIGVSVVGHNSKVERPNMKNQTLSMRRGHDIRARRTVRNRHRLRRTPHERAANQNIRFDEVTIYSKSSVRKVRCLEEPTHLPAELCMRSTPNRTVESLESLRRFLFKQPKTHVIRPGDTNKYIKGYHDLSTVREVSTPAALLLLAEFERRLLVKNHVTRLVNVQNWHPPVLEKLRQIGFFSALGFDGEVLPFEPQENPNVRVMRFIRGKNNDELQSIGDQLRSLIDYIGPAVKIGDDTRKLLNGAIAEAVTNVSQHAYSGPHEFRYPHVSSFWFAAEADLQNKRLSVSMYDQGHTIPKTYDSASWDKRAVAFLLNLNKIDRNDAVYIEAAVKYGSSRTGDNHRGYGLPQICGAIERCPGGRILIASRSGLYTAGAGIKPATRVLNGSVGGTLISWEVSFNGVS